MTPDTLDLLATMVHVLGVILTVIAIALLIAVARGLVRRDVTSRADRQRIYNRAGLDSTGEHHLAPDDDPVWQAGQRAARKERGDL